MTVVYGCFGCGGEEDPRITFTAIYRDQEGKLQMHWLCQACLKRFGPQKAARELTHLDKHPDAQPEFNGCSPIREVEEITQGIP